MTGEPDLISVLHRADWTRLCLSADVSDGSTLLVAPGRRYREQMGEHVKGCDGDRPWELALDAGERGADGRVHLVGGPEPPLPALLCPAWLLTSYRLEVRGHLRACGRDALHVVATGRPGIRRRITPADRLADRIEAMVDTELGILLRLESMTGNQAPQVTELVRLDPDPVIDPAQFTPPPGSLIGKRWGEVLGAGGPVWWAWKTAAGIAAGGLGAWIRHSPSSQGQPAAEGSEGFEAAIPHDDPAPELSPQGLPSGPQVGVEVLHLLHRSGTGEYTATLHQWHDFGAMMSQVPTAARQTGFGGLGLLADAISERPATAHLVSGLRVGGPAKYQIDHAYQPRQGPKTIACDGQHRWQVYGDKVTVGPAAPPPTDIADLADASWLLACRISGGAPITAGGRAAYRINIARGYPPWSSSLLFPAAVAVVDAELGILLRLTSYLGGKPVRRYELRDITAGAGDFHIDIPPGMPTVEEPGPFRDARPPQPANIPLKVASVVARQAAAEAAKAARSLLRRIDPH